MHQQKARSKDFPRDGMNGLSFGKMLMEVLLYSNFQIFIYLNNLYQYSQKGNFRSVFVHDLVN